MRCALTKQDPRTCNSCYHCSHSVSTVSTLSIKSCTQLVHGESHAQALNALPLRSRPRPPLAPLWQQKRPGLHVCIAHRYSVCGALHICHVHLCTHTCSKPATGGRRRRHWHSSRRQRRISSSIISSSIVSSSIIFNISFSSRQCCVYICTRAWFPFFFSTTTQPQHPLPATSSPPLPTSVACPFGRALGFPSLAPSPTNPDTAFAQLQQIAELLQQGKDVLIVPVDEEDDDDSVVR